MKICDHKMDVTFVFHSQEMFDLNRKVEQTLLLFKYSYCLPGSSLIALPWEFHRERALKHFNPYNNNENAKSLVSCVSWPVGRSTGPRDRGLRQLRLSQAPEPICRSVYLLESVFPRPRHPSFDKKLRVLQNHKYGHTRSRENNTHTVHSNTIINFGNSMRERASFFV